MIQNKINMNSHEKAIGNVLKGKNIEGRKVGQEIRRKKIHVGNDMKNK